jgi:hypothetical protein
VIGPFIPSLSGQTVTVAELKQFLSSKSAQMQSDAEIVQRLSSVTLSERLTEFTLGSMLSNSNLGSKAAEQVKLLADSSQFLASPKDEEPMLPAPDPAAQDRIITAARDYVNGTLRHLPDFLATRATESFDNTPQRAGRRPAEIVIQLHWVGSFHRGITYRNGHEETDSPGTQSESQSTPIGLSSWGEFGPVLKIVLFDSFEGRIAWSRWEKNRTGAPLAVFHYNVPKTASHYLVDFCCYWKSEYSAEPLRFRDRPGYHGDIYVDPLTGVIERMTLEAELSQSDPVTASGIAVEYGDVNIDGKDYVCPLRSIAISVVHNRQIISVDGIGLEKHINEVRFLSYHKFGSTTRIFAPDQEKQPH